MKIERSKVSILRISQVPGLDPIRVTLDDIGPGQGRINIECWGKAWASYWGGMGSRSISEFFRDCTNEYLIGRFDQRLAPTRFSPEALEELARSIVCKRLRYRDIETIVNFERLEAGDARRLWDKLQDLQSLETLDACWQESKLMSEVFGEEWWYFVGDRAVEQCPDYAYLSRICDVVRDGLRDDAQSAAGV